MPETLACLTISAEGGKTRVSFSTDSICADMTTVSSLLRLDIQGIRTSSRIPIVSFRVPSGDKLREESALQREQKADSSARGLRMTIFRHLLNLRRVALGARVDS